MHRVLKKLLGDAEGRARRRLAKRAAAVNAVEPTLINISDTALKAKSLELRQRLKRESLDVLLPDAFALVREAAKRTLGQRHFDVQIIGGVALHEGKVAEMKTGEGKTLVATLPVYLNALSGKGVHVVTVNDYLAQRDAGWMGQIYDFLGLSVGVIIPDASFIYDRAFSNSDHTDPRFRHLKPASRQAAYRADITYGTNNEFGFDYLRDNMVREVEQLRQRELNYAIVDEVDSILIDEARTPLIISAPSAVSGAAYSQFAGIARGLVASRDYEVDEKHKAVTLTDVGIDKLEKQLGIADLYATQNLRTIYHLNQALRAQALFKRDKDYVVTKDGEVVIVDEFTGRLLRGRRYNQGLHQAIEAKEGVAVQEESMTLATISFQNYFRLYDKLAGMTGTAMTEAEEFHQIYKLDTVEIPPNKKVIRLDRADRIYGSESGKYKAIVQEVKRLHQKGQPVLIGTPSIEKNELLHGLLKQADVPHDVLNAKNNESEAQVVARAGESGAVTLATNIAGRGTDIVLGPGVKDKGGLFVLGTERNESRRVDNQLRGRSGRQGDPGETQFYVSAEDDLLRIFGGQRIAGIMSRLGVAEDVPIENRVISKSLENAQKKVEGYNFDARKNVVQYDDVMNRHRRATYALRSTILHQQDISSRIKQFIDEEAAQLARSPRLYQAGMDQAVSELFPFSDPQLDKLFAGDSRHFERRLKQAATELYVQRENLFGAEAMRRIERDVCLQALDDLWMQHLEDMEHLREGVHWIQVGQKDPLVEYRQQAQRLFAKMQADLRQQVVRTLYRAEPIESSQATETELTRAARQSVDNAQTIIAAESYDEADFINLAAPTGKQVTSGRAKLKKARRAERQRRTRAKRHRR